MNRFFDIPSSQLKKYLFIVALLLIITLLPGFAHNFFTFDVPTNWLAVLFFVWYALIGGTFLYLGIRTLRRKRRENRTARWYKEFDLYVAAICWLDALLLAIGLHLPASYDPVNNASTSILLIVIAVLCLPFILALISLQLKWQVAAKKFIQKAKEQPLNPTVVKPALSGKQLAFKAGIILLYLLVTWVLILNLSLHFMNMALIMLIMWGVLFTLDVTQRGWNGLLPARLFLRGIMVLFFVVYLLELLLQLVGIHLSSTMGGSIDLISYAVWIGSSVYSFVFPEKAATQQA